MTTPIYCWWIDAKGNPWVKHECRSGDWTELAWRLPPPWHLAGDGIAPSLNCTRCGAHEVLGPSDRAPHNLWNWEIGEDDVCGSCDGKSTPDPECEWCHGTGIDPLEAPAAGEVVASDPHLARARIAELEAEMAAALRLVAALVPDTYRLPCQFVPSQITDYVGCLTHGTDATSGECPAREALDMLSRHGTTTEVTP